MKAYRFSEKELLTMNKLKELFVGSSYTFEPHRFPEVYYDDFANFMEFQKISDEPFHELENNNNKVDIDPDYLGIYRYQVSKLNTEEGIIILFKDRIENYSLLLGLDEEIVRFAVLMHELGHWLSHIAKHEGDSWKYGFNYISEDLKELIAQLIAYWGCEPDNEDLRVLYNLSPRFPNGIIDSTKRYGRYVSVTYQSKSNLLNKLNQVIKYSFLEGELLINFLISSENTLLDWLVNNGFNNHESMYAPSKFGYSGFYKNIYKENKPLYERIRKFIEEKFSNTEKSKFEEKLGIDFDSLINLADFGLV